LCCPPVARRVRRSKQNPYRLNSGDYVGIVINKAGAGIIRVKYEVNGVPPA